MWQKLKSMEHNRFYTAGVLIFIVLLIGLLHNFWILWGFLGIVYMIALYEASRLYYATYLSLQNSIYTILICGVIIWLGALLMPYSFLYPLWILFIILIIGASFQAYTKKGDTMMVMPIIYPTISFLTILAAYQELGIASMILLLIIVSSCDTFAFVGGKMVGKNAFCPTSPKKTIEGVFVGIGIATIAGGLFACLWWAEITLIEAFILVFLTALASVFGDLYESYLKRMANVKDSGTLLPGHGGVLDRVDGYLFAIIVLYPTLMWITNS